MKIFKQYSNLAVFSMLFMLTLFAAGCGSSGDNAAITDSDTPSAPSIVSTNPLDGAKDISLNRSVTATSDIALDAATVNKTTFTLASGTTAVEGNVSYADKTMLFNPTDDLNASTIYTATITTGVKDTAGNALAAKHEWTFTTGTTADDQAPTVTSTDPLNGAIAVPINRSVSALFDEALDPSTVNGTTFTLVQGSTPVTGTVSYASDTMIFDPASDLDTNTSYTATITTGVTDLAGNALAADKVWSFTTGEAAAPALLPVELGTAGNFAILSKTAISKTAAAGTAITGDIGVSPVTLTAVTGFSTTNDSTNTFATSTFVTGKIYSADMTPPTPAKMTTAISDMLIAYNDAAGRTLPDYENLGAGDVSGKILTPGLYKWGTTLLITNTGVTISGSATDVWIFQIAGDLTVNNGAIITLAGGALAKNIFWQVAGGAGVTLGTSADFKGVVLAEKSIIVNSGATVKGRLLAETAVTLDASPITQP